jgi:lipopolysaccharide export LptBFGC system permease protein LptF
MVFTLQRYVFRELFRIFLLATIGLTLILSLGGILRPVQEYGVGPRQVLHILLYFMPITLTFVLPMAALFASALAYGRFASDNELDACRASGISMATLVYPGLILAILVAIANLLLSFHVMPYFVHLAERSLKADAKQILFRNIQRRGFYCLPPENRFVIYADYADPKTDSLYGIVVVQSEREGIKRIITCESARVRFDPHDRFNELQLDAKKMRLMSGTDEVWVENAQSIRQEFGSLMGDDIKFKKIEEMKQIRSNLMLFDPIAKAARDAHLQLATELLAQDITKTLDASARSSYRLSGKSESVRFAAAGCVLQKESEIALQPPVLAEEYDGRTDKLLRSLSSRKAVIYIDEGRMDPASGNSIEPQLHLDLFNAQVVQTEELVLHLTLSDLALPESIRRALNSGDILQVTSPEGMASMLKGPPSPRLINLQRALARKIHTAMVDIKGEMNSRLVFGIGCIPMILIGIGLGIVKRGGHLLSAFAASCVPAVVLIVAIISGKHVTENVGSQGVSGILVMWAGLAFLLLLTAGIYGRLLRR